MPQIVTMNVSLSVMITITSFEITRFLCFVFNLWKESNTGSYNPETLLYDAEISISSLSHSSATAKSTGGWELLSLLRLTSWE